MSIDCLRSSNEYVMPILLSLSRARNKWLQNYTFALTVFNAMRYFFFCNIELDFNHICRMCCISTFVIALKTHVCLNVQWILRSLDRNFNMTIKQYRTQRIKVKIIYLFVSRKCFNYATFAIYLALRILKL